VEGERHMLPDAIMIALSFLILFFQEWNFS
jgi:hypothetical protein